MNAAPDFNRDHAMNIMVRYIADMAPETSTEVAEAYAIGQGHDEWLDDETHPVWDAAVDAFEEAYADAVAEYEQSEHAS